MKNNQPFNDYYLTMLETDEWKYYNIYIALNRAVNDYCERHGISRGAFAIRVGFNGENAENQLSNHLSPKNISHERKQMILEELDDTSRRLYFGMRVREMMR